MRVHIISDMEGVAGIVKWQQTTGGEKPYDEGRVLYTEEINAALRGATAAEGARVAIHYRTSRDRAEELRGRDRQESRCRPT